MEGVHYKMIKLSGFQAKKSYTKLRWKEIWKNLEKN